MDKQTDRENRWTDRMDRWTNKIDGGQTEWMDMMDIQTDGWRDTTDERNAWQKRLECQIITE